MSDSTRLAKFIKLLAIFLAAFSSVDFIMDFVRLDIGVATLKSFGMLTISVFLYLSIKRPELFKDNRSN